MALSAHRFTPTLASGWGPTRPHSDSTRPRGGIRTLHGRHSSQSNRCCLGARRRRCSGMTVSSPSLPSSRELADLWPHFHPWQPHALWLGQLLLHRIEAPFIVQEKLAL